jgi:hypothetical protein
MESMNDQNLDENTEDPNEETEYYMAMQGRGSVRMKSLMDHAKKTRKYLQARV